MTNYVVITPVRDEEKHLASTIESMLRQTVLPKEWVIVDDGSTDGTAKILDDYAVHYPWIRSLHRQNRGFRKSGSGVMEAFADGYRTLQWRDWHFLVKLDGDLSFSPDYFERCFQHFDAEPRLGIGGGEIYHNLSIGLTLEKNPRFHVRGATKIYKRACWEAIGGLWPAPGWDTIDEAKANMLGWKTSSFEELRLVHYRLTGSAEGLLRDRVKKGLAYHISGYHPLFVMASCMRRMFQKPYLIGSIAICFGFLKGFCGRTPRVSDRHLISYIRRQQLRRLFGLQTCWR
ncbi:MAG TPA: glycosyltransferase family A protein [Acidobacteriaceae bacterium]|nr:glycosyltransferase family A protein [Acidobacteriaceae bacterium]